MNESETAMLERLAAADAALPPTPAPPVDVEQLGRDRTRRRFVRAAIAMLVVAAGLFAYQSTRPLDPERSAPAGSESASAAMIAALTRAADRLERDVAMSVAELRASRARERASLATTARRARLDHELAIVRAEAALAFANRTPTSTKNPASRTNR